MGENLGFDFKIETDIYNWVIISLGGSLIVPDAINTTFISEFKKVIVGQVNMSKRFIIVCGGGKIARDYQKAYKIISNKTDSNILDLIGINATRLNAQLMAGIFGDIANQRVINNPNKKILPKYPVVFAGGWNPGWSTDYVAILLAKNIGARGVINLTNTDGVYDKDPNGGNGKSAKLVSGISWTDYRAMIPEKWIPGFSSPFDPVASREAQKRDIDVTIIGFNLKNLKQCLNGGPFKGTIISTYGDCQLKMSEERSQTAIKQKKCSVTSRHHTRGASKPDLYSMGVIPFPRVNRRIRRPEDTFIHE